jgi:ketosteroid isomerase-like protein
MPEESTTPDLVERVRRLNEAFNRRDFDAVESFFAPDAVSVGTELPTFEGAAAIRGFYEDAFSSYDDLHAEIEEVIDLGNGVTFAVLVITGHPVGSGGELQGRFVVVGSWTEGVIEREARYVDTDEARAAAERLAQERE